MGLGGNFTLSYLIELATDFHGALQIFFVKIIQASRMIRLFEIRNSELDIPLSKFTI